jgi:hypothetical protein
VLVEAVVDGGVELVGGGDLKGVAFIKIVVVAKFLFLCF